MAKFGKWIGAGLGWAFGGPIGGLIGLFIGSLFDTPDQPTTYSNTTTSDRRTQEGDFMISLVVVATAIMKADGTITKNELDYVKGFLLRNFGEARTREGLAIIKRLMDTDIPLDDVCRQIGYNMDTPAKEQLLYFLFGIAKSDGSICESEVRLLERIAMLMGISSVSFNSIKSMYYEETDASYTILGLEKACSDEELKRAYRKAAIENHPDKVAHLGEDVRKAAEEKFTRINVAYEKIKKQRGIA